MAERLVIALDQGTTSTRCIVFDVHGRLVSVAQREHRQFYPRPGWVEHDAREIWHNVQRILPEALAHANASPAQIAAMRPDVAIMPNGGKKGGGPDTIRLLATLPGLKGFWRLHESFAHPELTGDANMIANLSPPAAASETAAVTSATSSGRSRTSTSRTAADRAGAEVTPKSLGRSGRAR